MKRSFLLPRLLGRGATVENFSSWTNDVSAFTAGRAEDSTPDVPFMVNKHKDDWKFIEVQEWEQARFMSLI